MTRNKLFYLFSAVLVILLPAVLISSAAVTSLPVENPETVSGTYAEETTEKNSILSFPAEQPTDSVLCSTEDTTVCDNISENYTEASLSSVPDIIIDYSSEENATNHLSTSSAEKPVMIAFDKEYEAALSSVDDSKSYSFAADERGIFTYTLKHDAYNSMSGWTVSLYSVYYLNGSDGETGLRLINQLICTNETQVHNSVKIGVLPGSYRLIVTSYNGCVSDVFSVSVSFEARTDYEIECNDSINRYTELYADREMHGTASYLSSGSDNDWYMLRMYKPGAIRLRFSHATEDKATVCWMVVLYDAEGNVLYSQNSPFSSAIINSGSIGLGKGVYFIAVYGRVYCSSEYILKAERFSSSVYEAENNDTPERASSVTVNETIYGTTASRRSSFDRDYYSFELTEDGYIFLLFSHDPFSYKEDRPGWNVSLYSSDGVLLYKLTSNYSETEMTTPAIGLPAGSYSILVDSDNCYLSTVDYGICIAFNAVQDYETEPNNSAYTADILKEGKSISGNITDSGVDFDEDWYEFDIGNTGKVAFSFEHQPCLIADRDYFNISVFDEAGNMMMLYYEDGSVFYSGEIISFGSDTSLKFNAFLPEGKYHVRITAAGFYSNAIYSLQYTEETIQ